MSSINDLLTRLKASLTTQKRFLADAAHQLKTPLAGLRTQAELAEREIDSGRGDPASITFCESIKLDYVSCSPFRVPIARLAAAQASLSNS